jgi:hypothetical protein
MINNPLFIPKILKPHININPYQHHEYRTKINKSVNHIIGIRPEIIFPDQQPFWLEVTWPFLVVTIYTQTGCEADWNDEGKQMVLDYVGWIEL